MTKKKKNSKKKGSVRTASANQNTHIAAKHIAPAAIRFAASNAILADKKTIKEILSAGEWYLKSSKGKNNTYERKVFMTDGSLIRQTTSLSKTPSAKNAFKVQKKQLLKDEYWDGVSNIIIAKVAPSV